MEWTGSMKAVFCLLAFLHLSCYQRMVNAVPCTDQTLTITADNKLVLYINGVLVTGLQHANSPGIADTVPLSASVQVIAVSAENNGKNRGILGSATTFVTDGSWKCTDQFYEGWQNVGFDDSAWPGAFVVGPHGIKPWQEVEGVAAFAFWIWVSPGSTAKNIYCRKTLACDVTTTQPPTPTPTSTPTPTPTPTPTSTPTPTPTPTPTSTPTPPSSTFSTQSPTEGVRVPSCRGGAGETGPSCIVSCGGRANGDYQSCKGCQVYATCINEILHDERPCASGGFHWDDKVKRCEGKSATCLECK